MLACRIHAKDDLRIEAVDTPEVGPGQVLLRLGAGGICGSDIHYYYEGRNGSFIVREPLIPGHEASATVAAIGPGVTRVKVGDKVAVSPSHACGRCEGCREGREQLCRNMRFMGSASLYPHVQGMFSEFFVLGERQCYPVAGDVTLGELAFAEPLAVALHAIHRGTDLIGKSVLITGAGTIGCLTVMAARLAGAKSRDGVRHARSAAREGARSGRRPDAARRPRGRRAGDAAVRRLLRGVGQLRGAEVLRGGREARRHHRPGRHAAARAAAVRRQRADGEGARPEAARSAGASSSTGRSDYLSSRRVDVRPLLSGQFPLQDARQGVRAREGQDAEHQGAGRLRLMTCTSSRPQSPTSGGTTMTHIRTSVALDGRRARGGRHRCRRPRGRADQAQVGARLRDERAVPQVVGVGRRTRSRSAATASTRSPSTRPRSSARKPTSTRACSSAPSTSSSPGLSFAARTYPRIGVGYYPFTFRDADHLIAWAKSPAFRELADGYRESPAASRSSR